MRNYYKVYINQDIRVEKYSKILEGYWPYRFYATLSFQYELNDMDGMAFASQHLRRLNKKLLGKHWKKHGVKCLTGVATLEHAIIRKRTKEGKRPIKDRGSCHFHFLLHDHPCFDTDPNIALKQLTDAWEKSAHGLNYKITKKLVSTNGTDVQLFQTTGLYGYVLKEAKNRAWKDEQHLFLLDGIGLIPIDLSQF